MTAEENVMLQHETKTRHLPQDETSRFVNKGIAYADKALSVTRHFVPRRKLSNQIRMIAETNCRAEPVTDQVSKRDAMHTTFPD